MTGSDRFRMGKNSCHPAGHLAMSRAYIYSFGEEACNSHSNCTDIGIFQCPGSHARMQILPIERVLFKIVTLKNFDGCTSCMPSSPKEYIRMPLATCHFGFCITVKKAWAPVMNEF